MAESLNGQIVFEELHASKTLTRFVQSRIRKWLYSHPELSPLSYLVTLRREGQGHLISCRVEVRDRGAFWRASSCAMGIHRALIECLNHLMREPFPTPPGGSTLALSYALRGQLGPPKRIA